MQRRRNSLKLKKNVDRCSFYDNGGVKIGSYSQLAKFDVPSVWDIEDIVNLGIKKNSCPYYGTRLLFKTADIVFCPYNYIIDPVIRSTVSFSYLYIFFYYYSLFSIYINTLYILCKLKALNLTTS